MRLFVFHLSHGLVRVCEVELSHISKNNGNPDLVCEKNRIPGLRLLISSLPGSASRVNVEALGKHRQTTSVLEALPGKLDIK